MVRRNSLLGRALVSQRRYGEKLPGYGAVLGKIAADERSSQEFDKVVAIAKPASADELAAGLLDLVVKTALEAGMAAPRVDASGNRVGRWRRRGATRRDRRVI